MSLSYLLALCWVQTTKENLLWVAVVKAILSELWLERNQRNFQSSHISWFDRFESACLKFSSWYSLSKLFVGFLVQDIYQNWDAFISPL